MTDVIAVFSRAVDEWGTRLQAVNDDQWKRPTPCSDWDVRGLVNHIVNEELWAPPLLGGSTVEDVGDAFDGDLLGDDPKGAWAAAGAGALSAAQRPGVAESTVHVSFGDIPGREYLAQLITDHVIHSWDLARATEGDERLDPDLVQFAHDYLLPQHEQWRGAGVFGPLVEVPAGASLQDQLLGITGRRP